MAEGKTYSKSSPLFQWMRTNKFIKKIEKKILSLNDNYKNIESFFKKRGKIEFEGQKLT